MRILAAVITVSTLTGCASGPGETGDPTARREASAMSSSIDPMAEAYVKLALQVGKHDEHYVDAYYGPPEWQEEAASGPAMSLATIRVEAAQLLEQLAPAAGSGQGEEDQMQAARLRSLEAQLFSLVARADILDGKKLSFDEESKVLYDAVAPTHPDSYFQSLVDQLEPLLPGDGPLVDRYTKFREGFIIAEDRLDAVFRAAIEACEKKTRRHLELPAEERFELGYVKDKPWSGYNWYKGDYHSLIQINTDLPIYIDRAIDLACHEGYPGHHVYNALIERDRVRGRGWVEFTIYPLYSPMSLIAEGTANYGIEMAFPGEERVAFEREVLFPLAGIDPATASRYYEIQKKVERLAYAGNEAARRYLDGEIDAAQAAELLMRFTLMSRERAEQRVKFIERYRSYVINYNLGPDLARTWVEAQGGDPWKAFERLLSVPYLPSELGGTARS